MTNKRILRIIVFLQLLEIHLVLAGYDECVNGLCKGSGTCYSCSNPIPLFTTPDPTNIFD